MKAPALLLASAGTLLPNPTPHPDPYCKRTFTRPMFSQAARATYEGTRLPRRGAYGRLWRYAYCARPPFTTHRARLIWGRYLKAWATRRQVILAPMSYATASWYDDSTGQTASGFHAFYGVANLSLSFGTRVTFRYHGRQVQAVVDDRGPYVGGREWDLNQNTAGALGFSGVDTVGYRVGG